MTTTRMSSLNKMSFHLAVLISGNGSNLQAIIDAITAGLPAEITVVLSNNANAYGLERAKKADISTEVLSHRDFHHREDYDTQLIQCLDRYQPDLIVLAGFMRILSPVFIDHYAGKIINIHPSLLPKYPGLNTHQRVIEGEEPEHGISIHFVTNDLDGGPLIAQATFPVRDDDTSETLQKKGHQIEHQMYPKVIQWIAEGRIKQKGHHVLLDQEILPPEGYIFRDFSIY